MTKEQVKTAVSNILNENSTYAKIEMLGKDLGIKLSMDDFAHEIEDFITDALDELKDTELWPKDGTRTVS